MLARDQAEPLVGDGDRSADSARFFKHGGGDETHRFVPFAGMEFRQYIFNASHGESADGSSESLIGVLRPQVMSPSLTRDSDRGIPRRCRRCNCVY